MFRRGLLLGGTLLLAGAMFFVNPRVVEARGGGHGGGGHGGGFHGGGFHGGYHGGYRGFSGYRGGYYGHGYYGGYRGYYRPYYGGYYGRGYYGRGYGYGGLGLLGLYGLGYGYSPWWYGGGLLGNYYGTGGYYGSSPYYSTPSYYGSTPYYYGDSGYYDYVPQTTPSYDDSLPAPTSAPAHINVSVPADAQIWVNGQKVDSTGTTRSLTTPALSPGNQYTYDVKATWNDNGKPMTQTRQVIVTAGSDANVSFPSNTVSSR